MKTTVQTDCEEWTGSSHKHEAWGHAMPTGGGAVTGPWEGYGVFGDWVLPDKTSRHRQTGSPAVRPAVTSAGTTRTLVCRRLDECGTRPTGQRRVAAQAHGGGTKPSARRHLWLRYLLCKKESGRNHRAPAGSAWERDGETRVGRTTTAHKQKHLSE